MVNDIFKLVRSEDVVLFAGSGLSKYAGYPLGSELADMILSSLSNSEKNEIGSGLTLADLTETIVRLRGGKNELFGLLKKIFHKQPNTYKYHEILRTIPHIKTIITTNYDKLFELALGSEAKVIIKQEDVATIKDEREIFKIHGDFTYPESIVLLRSDFTQFFSYQTINNLLWANVKARLSNKSILFIGYDLEDSNIHMMLSDLSKSLGAKRRRAFLIAPGFKNAKKNFLNDNNIEYVDLKGEIFIEKLFENIRMNIVKDYDNDIVSLETLNKFFSMNDIQFDVNSKGQNISNLRGINQEMKADIKMKFKDGSDKKTKLDELISGNSFGNLTIEPQFLDDFSFSSKNINLIGNPKDFRIVIGSVPHQEGIVDLTFEDGFEVTDIPYKIFRSKKKTVVSGEYKSSTIELHLVPHGNAFQATFDYKLNEDFRRSTEAIATLKLLANLIGGVKFSAFTHSDKKFHEMPIPEATNDEFLENIKDNLEFYEVLRQVEILYKLNFDKIPEPSKEMYNKLMLATQTINEKVNEVKWEGNFRYNVKNKHTPLELILEMQEPGSTFEAVSAEPEIIEILGHQINIGHKHIVYDDLYVSNMEDIVNKLADEAIFKSSGQRVKIKYKKEISPGDIAASA
jgi:hypothetical protein